ncbi:ABC transporter permease [Bacillus sp. HMF5848]|uniref:ABC transporter permease n=1 Tax=Bacillus sp. HMF5848 TaxID=2495421 RepID=UPI000F781D14|nr:ABC transporter permease [Bacillus sp. HMF5848]RSK29126.1 ABC transporter permease [Bacillus sp. HMF5848]
MSINTLILRNFKKNISNYYLYVFALIFTVALYFAFVTLQYDPAMDATKGSIKGAASVQAASVLLVVIVSIFILYANNLFIKRRGKEIGLFQLIGLTKQRIFWILTAENFMIFFGSLLIGIFVGFSFSKLILMILFSLTGVETEATLRFSTQALIQTTTIFGGVYVLIMLMNYIFIKRQSILSLFKVVSTTEAHVRRVSVFEILIGMLGLIFIALGYFISTKLFGGDFATVEALFTAMITILALVILGTYLFYKGSVSFISNIIRKKKDGYLSITEVLSLSTIMFRMKSNSLLLTIITTVSALAIGLLSLSYISYYSTEKSAAQAVPAHFSIIGNEHAEQFKQTLQSHSISYSEKQIDVLQVNVNAEEVFDLNLNALVFRPDTLNMAVISDSDIAEYDLAKTQTIFTGYNDLVKSFMPMKESGNVTFNGKSNNTVLEYAGLKKEYYISSYFTGNSLPVAVVDKSVFESLRADINPDIQRGSSLYIGININDEEKLKQANDLFLDAFSVNRSQQSQLEMSNNAKRNTGLTMFIVGFLGLTFLITSGCILYFKQMGEGEDEKPSYTILRKLGYTEADIIKGIQVKQIYHFGIPLAVGLLHGYFAVKSGWFFFGTELWTPMIIVMFIYTALYSTFGILSVFYYKKVIKEAL